MSNAKFNSFLEFKEKELVGRPIMDIINSADPSDICTRIATQRFGERATLNLKVQFCVNENSPLWQERKYYSLLFDAYGI